MPNVELSPLRELSSFRRLAIGSWQTAYDPNVYGSIDVRMDAALRYIEAFRRRTGKRLTVTHLVAKAIAEALRRCPEANAILRWNRIYLRKTIDLSILVVQTDEGQSKADLAACTIREADQKSLYQLAVEIEEQVAKVRARRDAAMEQGKKTMNRMPLFFMNAILKLMSFLMYTLNLDLGWAGIPKDPFGSATITNIGSLGLDTGYVPLVPYTRVPIFVAPGSVREAAVVENGKIVPGMMMRLCATFDHRFIDGYHASVLSKTVHQFLEEPFEHLDRIDDLPMAATG
jgi:pyruvate dehydrogenase E2 component (dihydrolipoamide acetyltransferase)